MSKIPAFRIRYTVWATCDGFETEGDETLDTARIALSQELREGFRQIAYDLPWEIETASIEEVKLNV